MSPTWTFGTKYHFFSVSTPIFEAPLFIKSPYSSCKDLRGLSIPSNILLIIPGPKTKVKGSSSPITSWPIFNPVVPSYTWIVAISPVNFITSPNIF